MTLSWAEIEERPGFSGAEARARREITPHLQRIVADPVRAQEDKKAIIAATGRSLFAFAVFFVALNLALTDDFLGGVFRVVLFFALFLGMLALSLWIVRKRIYRMMFGAAERLGAKGRAMQAMAAPLGLTYVPAPGGGPASLKWLAAQAWSPPALRALAAELEAGGGMDGALSLAIRAGVMLPANTHVLGKPEDRVRLTEQLARQQRIEDGFHGRHAGLDVQMFEWIETVDDAPDVHHLVIVLQSPVRLNGVTQLRHRRAGWPADLTKATFTDVELGQRAFDQHYALRTTDQVEARAIFNPAVIERVIALAEGSAFRAATTGQGLVFDFPAKEDRLELVDLMTGEWSDETVRQAHSDLAGALALVEALGHAFMVRKSATGAA